ncbi:hypothetical protein NLG97_g5891 [Lecanicillium saksenae]|uniref:Uncharacterized protein n=1 Tax=Lecanicillium saksenae TaxID=468837 RepID=A0ACC1QSB8_9HYPO|nr:hypothetical protein NLG97_g5891 [Lecanicillium saksenae]
MSTGEERQLKESLQDFWRSDKRTQLERGFLKALLTNTPTRAPATRLPDDIEIRAKLGHIQVIFRRYTEQLNAPLNLPRRVWSQYFQRALSFLSEGELQRMSANPNITEINLYLGDLLDTILQAFGRRYLPPQDVAPAGSDGVSAPRLPLRPEVLARDKKCVITGRSLTLQVCHIWNYAALQTTDDANAFLYRRQVLDRVLGSNLAAQLCSLMNAPGATEVAWNLITLCGDMHGCFDNGEIGLEPLDADVLGRMNLRPESNTIYVRVEWFNPGAETARQISKAPTFESLKEMMRPTMSSINKNIQDVNIETGQPVISGNVYPIVCPEHCDRMETVLKARWILQKLRYFAAAMDAEREDPDRLPPPGRVFSDQSTQTEGSLDETIPAQAAKPAAKGKEPIRGPAHANVMERSGGSPSAAIESSHVKEHSDGTDGTAVEDDPAQEHSGDVNTATAPDDAIPEHSGSITGAAEGGHVKEHSGDTAVDADNAAVTSTRVPIMEDDAAAAQALSDMQRLLQPDQNEPPGIKSVAGRDVPATEAALAEASGSAGDTAEKKKMSVRIIDKAKRLRKKISTLGLPKD